ncbi:hypothetical protein HaLaN_28346, partial [Haematococcus lacustris]
CSGAALRVPGWSESAGCHEAVGIRSEQRAGRCCCPGRQLGQPGNCHCRTAGGCACDEGARLCQALRQCHADTRR